MENDLNLAETVENLPETSSREKILSFENAIANSEGAMFGDNDHCPLKHTFGDGVYVREIFIPAGTLIVGKIHKHKHPNFLLKGKVSVYTEQNGVEKLEAPLSIISKAGTKRVVYAHEDAVWITVHVTDKTNLTEIESEIISPDYCDYDLFANNAKKMIEGS